MEVVKVATTGNSLWDIPDEFRASLGEDIGGDESGEDVEASELIEGQLALAEVLDGGDDG